MEEKKLYGYAILIDQEILQKRAKEEGLDLLIERAKESAEIDRLLITTRKCPV